MANTVEIVVKVRDAGAQAALRALGNSFKGLGALIAGSNLLAMAGPLASAGLALGAFAAVAAPSLEKVKKALTSTGTAATTAWAKLSPAQVDLAHDVQGLQHQFDALQTSMAPVVARVADLAVKTAGSLMPALGGLARAGASVLSDVLRPMRQLFQSDFFASFVKSAQHMATTIGPVLGNALAGLLRDLMKIFKEAGPAGAQMLSVLLPVLVRLIGDLAPVVAAIANVTAGVLSWIKANHLLVPALIAVGVALLFSTGGLSVVVGGIALVVAGLVDLWKHSETFRSVVTSAFSNLASATLTQVGIIVRVLHFMADQVLTVAGVIIHGMAAAMGWAPGIGPKIKAAAAQFDAFRSHVDKIFSDVSQTLDNWKTKVGNLPNVVKIEGDITDLQAKLATAEHQLKNPDLTATRRAQIQANIDQLKNAIAAAKALLQSINGTTATTYVQTIPIGGGKYLTSGHASGGIIGAASGGMRRGATLVGEHGPELVDLPPGAQVHSNPDSMRMLGGSGPGQFEMVVSFEGHPDPVIDALMRGLRARIRAVGGGGTNSVQRALGQAF